MDITSLLLITIGIVNFFFTLLVFSRNPKHPINISFALFIINATVWAVAIAFFRTSIDSTTALFWAKWLYFAGTLVPTAFLLFAYSLTEGRFPPRRFTALLILIPLAFTLILLFTDQWIGRILLSTNPPTIRLGPAYVLWLIYYGLFMGLGIYRLLIHYRRTTGFPKTQVRFVLLAIFFPVAGALPFNILLPWWGDFRSIHIGPLFVTFMVAIVSYAIVRHRLFDIRLVVARLVAYTVLVAVLGTIYALGIYGFGLLLFPTVLGSLSQKYLLLSTGLAIFIAFTFQPLRRFFERTTDRFLYKDRYETDELLLALGKILAGTIDLQQLGKRVARLITTRMHLTSAAVMIPRKGHCDIIGASLPLSTHECLLLRDRKTMLIFEELPEGKYKAFMRAKGVIAIVPLSTKEKIIGYLLLGNKSSGDIFYAQDIAALQTLAPEVAVAIQNAQAYEEIRRFNMTLREKVKKATEQLRGANTKLKELDTLKNEFLTMASHDLRTPMSAIKGFLWMIRNEKLTPKERQQYLERAYAATERLLTLVNDMLDVSRLERGKIELHPVRIYLPKLALEVKEELSSKAAEKKISISIAGDKAYVARADREKMRQVLVNLIGNAIKYTNAGGKIAVSFSYSNDMVGTAVSDTGTGIKKEDLSRMFTKFTRLDQRQPGTGLGLYICKKMVELSGGKISVKSEVDKGSTFLFTLPRG